MREFDGLAEYLNSPRSGARYIFSPFLQKRALSKLLSEAEIPTVIVTRWRPEDVAAGVSDPECFEFAAERGYAFRVHDALHLKVYSWNLADAIVGSANVTEAALGFGPRPNEEYLTEPLAIPLQRRIQLQRLVQEAPLVTRAVFSRVKAWTEAQPLPPRQLLPFPTIAANGADFLTSVLPMSDSPLQLMDDLSHAHTSAWSRVPAVRQECALHDAVNYGLDVPTDEFSLGSLRRSFIAHPFIAAIDSQLAPCLHFGELKAWIQRKCHDVPVPSRRDLTGKVQTLMTWFVELYPDRYQIDVPGRYSERLCKESVV